MVAHVSILQDVVRKKENMNLDIIGITAKRERRLHMEAFDMVIGHSSIKQELMQISGTPKNREFYDKLGASAPTTPLPC